VHLIPHLLMQYARLAHECRGIFSEIFAGRPGSRGGHLVLLSSLWIRWASGGRLRDLCNRRTTGENCCQRGECFRKNRDQAGPSFRVKTAASVAGVSRAEGATKEVAVVIHKCAESIIRESRFSPSSLVIRGDSVSNFYET
jgi:hypothetical protein